MRLLVWANVEVTGLARLYAQGPVDCRVRRLRPTPAMIEAGGWAHAWWRLKSDEWSDEVIAESIFKCMVSVLDGTVTLDQVKAQIDSSTADEFFRTTLSGDSA